jgi:hypothetical protein
VVSLAGSSARTIVSPKPRAASSASSRVIPTVAGIGGPPGLCPPGPPWTTSSGDAAEREEDSASARGAGVANHTAFPRRLQPPRRARVRWYPQRPWDISCTTSSPRPLIESAGTRRPPGPGAPPRTQPG